MNSNKLIHESSPYLLQHAHNPVDWHAWNEDAWTKAQEENKLVLISIGYSSCHWCHVMERESFEDVSTAELMNRYFICIKVDREERPDVDHVYMSAVQLMTGQGGWPLNCICLPDGKPVYGGTYFPNAQWKSILVQLHNFYEGNPEQARKYAEELTHGLSQMEMVIPNPDAIQFSKTDLKTVVEHWRKSFDYTEGGPNRAPKFPMPNNYEFLLHYAVRENDEDLKNYVLLTLDKMAFGGIYDQVGGGFARYSTDFYWKVPHFEKMLYDNAQLVSLYSHAYQLTKKELYKEVVYETLGFINREMTSPEGGFYSALDADSEGVEGKFYVWTKEELSEVLPEKDYRMFEDYYNVNEKGFWEEGYILLRKDPDDAVANRHGISVGEMKKIISDSKKHLLDVRSKRTRPGLDDKQLTSWNALMIQGYCDAYRAFQDENFLDIAIRATRHILDHVVRHDGGLHHSYKNGKATINGYLEDYSFFTEALISLYECTGDEKYLEHARHFTGYAIQHFLDAGTGLFFFTSDLDPRLIARKKEIHDNVVPASNSSMAKALFRLGKFFENEPYPGISETMLHHIKNEIGKYGSSFSNWCELMMWNVYSYHEVVVAGPDAVSKRSELLRHYLPEVIMASINDDGSRLSLLEKRFVQGKTLIYVCKNRSCRLPVGEVHEAISMIREGN